MVEAAHASPLSKLATGVPGLDAITHGGIPQGRTTLITGTSGAGKSILSLQIATSLAAQGVGCLYVAVEERPADLENTAVDLFPGAAEQLERGRLVVADFRKPADGPVQLTGDYDAQGVIARILGAARDAGTKAVVIDSSTALFQPRPEDNQLRALFFQLVQSIEEAGLTLLLTSAAPADYATPTLLGVEDYVCDLVLVLRNVVDGKRRRRTVEVHKYRRSSHNKGEYPCTIAALGVTVFPLDAQVESMEERQLERFSSGLEGLDRINHGGWLRDSIVLVRGPSGSGKTTLAGMYARAGAMRGERVVYYGFEETRGILLRNFKSLDMPMEAMVEAGRLKFDCKYPEATSPEDLLIELRRDLDETDPSLVVLDSISSIEHSTSQEGFRIFLVGLAALLRARGRSALLTQTISSHSESRLDAPYLSTVADAILMVDYTADRQELTRSLRVLKMRGSPHDSRQHRLRIDSGGLSVSPPGE